MEVFASLIPYRKLKKKIEISVTDTGTGIPKDQQEAVFERFYKMNSFTQGTGLGLPICRSIAEKLGGSLRIDTSYTEGCRMILTLPFDICLSKKLPELPSNPKE